LRRDVSKSRFLGRCEAGDLDESVGKRIIVVVVRASGKRRVEKMRKTATTIRCVPRYGYAATEVRTIDIDVPDDVDERELLDAVRFWFASRGIADAIYDLDTDDNGYFVIVNDEAYANDWGTPLL